LDGFALMSNGLDSLAYSLWITQVFVPDRSQFGVQFIHERYAGRDVQVHDVVIADLVEVLHQGPQAVAVGGDEHSPDGKDGRYNHLMPVRQEAGHGVFQALGAREFLLRKSGVAAILSGEARIRDFQGG
jgi:hypothetical protein